MVDFCVRMVAMVFSTNDKSAFIYSVLAGYYTALTFIHHSTNCIFYCEF